MKKIWIATTVVLLVCLAAFSTGHTSFSAKAAGVEINVTGEACLKLKPDGAEFNIGVTTVNPAASKAETENDSAYRNIYNALVGAGVDAEEIIVDSYNVYPIYDYEHGRQLTGYEVNRTIKCHVRGSNVDGILKAAIEAGATNIDSLKYLVDDYTAAYRRAMALALNDARTKAETLAEGTVVLKNITEEQCYWCDAKYDCATEKGGDYDGLAEIYVRLNVVYCQ